MLRTKLASVAVATFLMTLIWTLPTVYAGHCKGQHANDPLCPPPPPPPADVHDDLKADHADLVTDHADLVTDHDGLGLASEHTGLATDNDGLATDHDALATDHDGLALGAPASELVTLINNQTIQPGNSIQPTAIDVSDAKFITFLGIVDSGPDMTLRYRFLSSSGTFNDPIPKSLSLSCTIFLGGIGIFTSGPDRPFSSQVHGPFFAIRIFNGTPDPTTLTVQAWLQR